MKQSINVVCEKCQGKCKQSIYVIIEKCPLFVECGKRVGKPFQNTPNSHKTCPILKDRV